MIASRYKPDSGREDGGMSSVVFCTDTHLNRCVALKYLQPGVDGGRLFDEQKALLKLRSRHVVQLFDVVDAPGPSGPIRALVLEFIDGKDMSAGQFTAGDKFLHALWQIACGLADVHDAGVVHRDIKPSNIRIDVEGVVKILDFGLSRSADRASTQSVIGTPPYMAPELWSGSTISFSSAVDVYAFGVMAMALVHSQAPSGLFQRPPVQPSLAEVSSSMVGCAPDLVSVIHQCLSSSPGDRPSMVEIRELLARNLLKGKHRASVVLAGTPHILDAGSKSIYLRATVGELGISYDDFDFKVSAVVGNVFINNVVAAVGMTVPGCCVLTFGVGTARRFVTFDVSRPEVSS